MCFTVCRIDHIVVNTVCIDQSLAFYINILGCELVRQIEQPEIYQLKAGNSMIDLRPVKQIDEYKNTDHFCLQIYPFKADELLPYLEKNCVPHGSIEQRNGALGFGASLYIEDPDGNCIELKSK